MSLLGVTLSDCVPLTHGVSLLASPLVSLLGVSPLASPLVSLLGVTH